VRFLFVHQNFPGQFLHLVRALVDRQAHDLVFITEENGNLIPGVRKAVYRMPAFPDPGTHPGTPPGTHRDAQEFDGAMTRAGLVATVAANLRALGFQPDIIIGHHGWGEMLNMQDVFPGVPLLGYFEFFYNLHGYDVNFDPEFPSPVETLSRIRAKNAINLLALTNPGHGQTPTRFQQGSYPAWAQPGITVLPEGVNLDVCRPDPAAHDAPLALPGFEVLPGDKLITYVARDLEPYRGFHVVMRALPALLRQRPDVKVVLVGADGVSYGARLANGTWREWLMGEVGPGLDASRVHFPGRLDYETYVRLLQRSDAHVYLTYPFVASWSLREALACGCAIIGSDTPPVQEFVRHGATGLLTPFQDPAALADAVLGVLDDERGAARLRAGARAWAEANLRMDDHITGYYALINRMTDGRLGSPAA
jgi:glycosyltransferase involved in cell wall biosynthesis